MATSYSTLMRDHHQIEHLGRLLDDDVNFLGKIDAADSRQHLIDLCLAIIDHIKAERQVIALVEQKGLTSYWGGRWPGVLIELNKLNTITLNMLSTWDDVAIRTDWPAFKAAVKNFSLTCQSATRREVDSFYATALQSGALPLR